MSRNKVPLPQPEAEAESGTKFRNNPALGTHKYIPSTDWPSATHSRVCRGHWDVHLRFFSRRLPSQMPTQDCTTRAAVTPTWPLSVNLNKTCFPSHSDWLLDSLLGNQEPTGGGVHRGPTSDIPPSPPTPSSTLRDSRVAGSAVLRSESRSTAKQRQTAMRLWGRAAGRPWLQTRLASLFSKPPSLMSHMLPLKAFSSSTQNFTNDCSNLPEVQETGTRMKHRLWPKGSVHSKRGQHEQN